MIYLKCFDNLKLAKTNNFKGYMAYIKSLNINDTPEIFGLHDNANITFAQNETFRVLQDLLELQPKSLTGGGATREEIIEKVSKDILQRVPLPLKIETVMEKFPVMYEQSMNTVIVQEVIRFVKYYLATSIYGNILISFLIQDTQDF